MKKTRLTCIFSCATACLLAAPLLAQDSTPPAQPGTTAHGDREAGHSKQFLRTKDLIGANVKDSAGEKIGDIKEIYLNPQNGQTFASIDIGKGRHAPVPLQALTVAPPRGAFRNAEATLNKSKADMEMAPSVSNNEWTNLDNPSFTQRIYTHYNVPAPSAVGGTGSATSTGAGATSSGKATGTQQP